ncbi:hypothetical protein SUGI_1086810 [Cryptomeria japonica]|uniref:uncharacterized protein LOC131859198 n=1 Tax=Cryptomeria japonica TaxID=3369 RepID=UPI002414CAF1|nr:uncharacterized protein LOC131859198 [Cryptomeria japonica]GLJ51048.1 hypothetical protein SUGI_1086810 [Cryptomeria japonica]
MSTVDSYRGVKDQHSHDNDEHSGESFSRLMQRVHSLEDLLRKLRWERSAETKEEMAHSHLQSDGFRVPLHYPNYSKADYESMEEWRLDFLFHYYGLDVTGDVEYKRNYAIGAFLWPDQCT